MLFFLKQMPILYPHPKETKATLALSLDPPRSGIDMHLHAFHRTGTVNPLSFSAIHILIILDTF